MPTASGGAPAIDRLGPNIAAFQEGGLDMRTFPRAVAFGALLVSLLYSNSLASAGAILASLHDRAVADHQRDQSSIFSFSRQTGDSTRLHRAPSPLKLKSPYMAAFYSVIPGAVVHGCGHIYAGEGNTGVLLLGLEFTGGVLLFLGFQSSFGGASHQGDADMLGFAGLFLFAGSWVYDMVGSPIAVVRRNRYIRETEGSGYDFKRQPREFRLTFAWHF
jgi:hypothetical protein